MILTARSTIRPAASLATSFAIDEWCSDAAGSLRAIAPAW